MSYLLNVTMGKENLVKTILQKKGIPSQLSYLKGYLVSDVSPPFHLLDQIPYIYKVIEVSEEEAKKFLDDPQPKKDRLRPGFTVEVVSGIYQDFKGIVREVMDGSVKVDLAIFGKVVPVEFQASELKTLIVCDSWV
jgi:transcription antitermination factor NusG